MQYIPIDAKWFSEGNENIVISATAVVLFLCLVICVFGHCGERGSQNGYSSKKLELLDYDDDTDAETEMEDTDLEMQPLYDE